MIIVTSGSPYIDIDAYAGCIAYSELLNLQDFKSIPASTSVMNKSITNTIKSWPASFDTSPKLQIEDRFILVDISNPKYLDTIVNHSRIIEVIDHHLGFEEYWSNQIGNKAQIEFIGSVCTLIFEKWQSSSLIDKISQTSARLLVCGILDNTLNFGAKVTTDRDKQAYHTLLEFASLPNNWTDTYFSECQSAIESQLTKAIQNDTKKLSLKSYSKELHMGQLTVWNAQRVISMHDRIITTALAQNSKDWLLNIISISEQKSYFFADNKEVQSWLYTLIDVRFEENIGISNRLWLRKEILKEDLSF